METIQKMILIEQNRLSELNTFLENGWKVVSTTPVVKCLEKYDTPFYGVYVVIEKEKVV
jgi:hypothetical protein